MSLLGSRTGAYLAVFGERNQAETRGFGVTNTSTQRSRMNVTTNPEVYNFFGKENASPWQIIIVFSSFLVNTLNTINMFCSNTIKFTTNIIIFASKHRFFWRSHVCLLNVILHWLCSVYYEWYHMLEVNNKKHQNRRIAASSGRIFGAGK